MMTHVLIISGERSIEVLLTYFKITLAFYNKLTCYTCYTPNTVCVHFFIFVATVRVTECSQKFTLIATCDG